MVRETLKGYDGGIITNKTLESYLGDTGLVKHQVIIVSNKEVILVIVNDAGNTRRLSW